ncbi:MAG: hypothetical protein IT306_18655 [Chloroflexi bacterium]|nr:hypothetical protein [Chloroflexota bacterium]
MHPLISSFYASTLQFALGSLLAAVICDQLGEVTPGFLRLAAASALASAWLAWMLTGSGVPGEGASTLALTILLLGYTVLQFTAKRQLRLGFGWLGVAAGVVGMALAAGARPSPSLGPLWTGLTAAASATALGTSVMSMVLGHWYLMTPRLSARPLRILCDLSTVSLVLLSGLALWYVLERPVATTFGPDTPWFRWTGFVSVTVVPIGITVAARLCCQEWPRGRAIQAATGLLYISSAMVLAAALAGNMVVLGG